MVNQQKTLANTSSIDWKEAPVATGAHGQNTDGGRLWNRRIQYCSVWSQSPTPIVVCCCSVVPRARERKINFCTITAFFFFFFSPICWEGAYGVLHVVCVLAVLFFFFFHFNVVVYHCLDPLFLCKETKAVKSLSYMKRGQFVSLQCAEPFLFKLIRLSMQWAGLLWIKREPVRV